MLQVASIPFSDVSDMNGKVHFLLKGDESTTVFDGTLAGDVMSGTFADGSALRARSNSHVRHFPQPESGRAMLHSRTRT
jgi:hypothetical protein